MKNKKHCPDTYDDILIKQSRSIIFPSKGGEVSNEFCSQTCAKIVSRKIVSRRGDLEIKNFRCLKTKFGASKTTRGMHCSLARNYIRFFEFSIIHGV